MHLKATNLTDKTPEFIRDMLTDYNGYIVKAGVDIPERFFVDNEKTLGIVRQRKIESMLN